MSFNRPIALMCYICGREYGTKSLSIHLKTCQQKWEIEEGKKPRAQRRPMPLPPAGLDELLSNPHITAADISDFNSGAFKKYNNEALVKCPNCNRTFKPEALAHHQKACSKENPFKPLPGAGGQSDGPSEYADNDANSLVPCSYCNRKFAPDRIAKHESVCPKFDKSKAPQIPQKPLNQLKPGTGGSMLKQNANPNSTSSSSFGSSMKQPVRPKTLVCYICGREYGTKSLQIHLKTCQEKWEIEQSKLPKKDRRPMPQPPRGLFDLLQTEDIQMDDIESYNKNAFNSYNYTALVPCKHCGRTFKQEAFDHHSKVCTAENPFKPLNREGQDSGAQDQGGQDLIPCSKCSRKFAADRVDKHEAVCKGTGGAQTGSSGGAGPKTAPITIKKTNVPQQPPEPKMIQRPKTLVCYICGREFGTASLAIHLKSCEQKWYNEQEKLPKKDRRPLPKQPAALTAMLNGQVSSNDMEAYNSKAMDTYNTDSLMTCKFCSRTFTESALAHHSKVCTAEKPFKAVNKPAEKTASSVPQSSYSDAVPSKGYNLNNIPEDDEGGDSNLVPCSKCGRNFNADRVAKHEKVCKGPSELKKKEIEPPKTEKPKQKKEGNWKAQHEEFIQSMQYMKKVKEVEQKGGDIRSIGPPPKANTDNLIPCPYCGRKFNEQVAERHIPSCKNVINKPKSIAQSAPKTFSQQNGLGATAQSMKSPYKLPGQSQGTSNPFTSPTKSGQSKILGTSSLFRISQGKNIFKKS